MTVQYAMLAVRGACLRILSAFPVACVCCLSLWYFGAETLYVTYTTVVVTNTKYIFDVAQYNPISEDYEETSLIRTPFIYPITLFRQ